MPLSGPWWAEAGGRATHRDMDVTLDASRQKKEKFFSIPVDQSGQNALIRVWFERFERDGAWGRFLE